MTADDLTLEEDEEEVSLEASTVENTRVESRTCRQHFTLIVGILFSILTMALMMGISAWLAYEVIESYTTDARGMWVSL